jgi:hypothetical protein
MAIRLVVEGRVVERGVAYVIPDAVAARWQAEGEARREQWRVASNVQPFVTSRDVLGQMALDGRLPAVSYRAGQEIARHWHDVTRALFPRCGLYGERMPRSVEVLEAPGVAARTGRYLAWAAWAQTRAVTARATVVEITFDLVVDGLTCRGIRAKRGIGQQRALEVVRGSLWGYARLAGWLTDVEARNAA